MRPNPSRVAARYAYMPGVRDPNGWEPGRVEPGAEEYEGEGSQVPPARDQDGKPVEKSATRMPPHLQRQRQAIGRAWLQGDHDDAESILYGAVDQWLREYDRDIEAGKNGSFPLAVAKWFRSAAPVEMDTSRTDRLFSGRRLRHASRTASMVRTAGEVRFIKDRSGDAGEWAFGPPGPNEREIQEDFVFNARHLKPLAQTLRSALMALGHVTSAYNKFVKIKSRNVSPDGSLGGKGYIQKITDMRRQLMNCVEALSALTDTIYDEMTAPHWNPTEDTLDPRDREEVKEIIEDAEEIKDDPEAWASGKEEELDEDNVDDDAPMGKTAAQRVVLRHTIRRLV